VFFWGGVFVWFWFSVRQRASREQCVLKNKNFSLQRKTESTLLGHLRECTSSGELDFGVVQQRGLEHWKLCDWTLVQKEKGGDCKTKCPRCNVVQRLQTWKAYSVLAGNMKVSNEPVAHRQACVPSREMTATEEC